MSFPICGSSSSHSTRFYASLCVLRILLACGDAIVKFKDKRKLYRQPSRDTHENLIKILIIDIRTFFPFVVSESQMFFSGLFRLSDYQKYVANVVQLLRSEHVDT